MDKPHHYLAETIAEVTNLRALEIYRDADVLHEAQWIDDELNKLSKTIIEAISEVPEPDMYEVWLRERKKTELYPIPEPEETTPIDDADPDEQPAVFNDSNETATAGCQRPAETPRGDKVPAVEVVQAGTTRIPDRYAIEAGDLIRKKLIIWMEHNGLGVKQAAEKLHVDEGVLRSIRIQGDLPHPNIINQLCDYVNALKPHRQGLLVAQQLSNSVQDADSGVH